MTKPFGSAASYKIIAQLEAEGYEAVFVGGAVRDYLLGQDAKDIDIATSAEPFEVKKVFSNTIDVGIDHGTVLVIVDKEPIEVTTYRTEGTYSDARRPDQVYFVKSLKEDLLRRDFTINALAMTYAGEIIDLFGGQSDMASKVIRAVGEPVERFHEDALRMVRAVRFSSALDFSIEQATLKAIEAHATRIQHVSVERIKIELDKLFMGKNPLKAFGYIASSRLGKSLPLFPNRTVGLEQSIPFVSTIEGWAFMMIAGEFQANRLSRAYKLSNDERKYLSAVEEAFKIRKVRLFTVDDYYRFEIAILKTTENFHRAIFPKELAISHDELIARKEALPIQSKQDLAVSGKDLLTWAGHKAGRWTGEWIGKIEYAVLHGLCENNPIKIKEWFINDFKSEE